MNQKRVHTPEGVRDIYGQECREREEVKDRLSKVFDLYGYESIMTPAFEFFDIFNREKGTVSSREMYKFFDRNNNTLVLRPDVTPSIARCVAKYFGDENMNLRLCYGGRVFLNHSSYQLKLKETFQLGAELVNDDSAYGDAEILSMAVKCFLAAGIKEFRISIGQVDYFNGLAKIVSDEDVREELREFILNKNYFGLMEFVEELAIDDSVKNVFRQFDELNGDASVLDRAFSMVDNQESKNAIEHLRKVYGIMEAYGLERYISFDLGMLNQHNYYTGIIFKGYTYGTGDAVLKGGRYNNLIEQFGKKAPSVGFVIVLDELMAALSRQKIHISTTLDKTMIVYEEDWMDAAVFAADKYRNSGHSVIMEIKRSEKSLDDYVDYGANHGVEAMIAFTEPGQVTVMNLNTREHTREPIEQFMKGLKP